MNERTPRDVGQGLAATIVSSYVKHNKISANDLPTIIASVYQALSSVGKPVSPTECAFRSNVITDSGGT
jgi:predicted transcriptional regulator